VQLSYNDFTIALDASTVTLLGKIILLETFISVFPDRVLISEKVRDMSTKTLSIRMNDEDYQFLSTLAKEEREDISKKVRELVDLGRMMLAIEKYKKSEASIEKSARIAGVSISKMVDILREHGIEANLEYEDYLSGLKSLRKVW